MTNTDVPTLEDLPLASEPGKFTHGSTLRHVVVMSAAGSIGLMAIFSVDLLNLLYISWLGDKSLTAAVGYASTTLFFLVSICIGITIAITAVVSHALGARERKKAETLSTDGLVYMSIITVLLTLVFMLLASPLLRLMGAEGETYQYAYRFLMITLPATPFLGIGMAFTGILRAVGDANRAMWVTLGGGIGTAILDPIFIFGFGLGLDGAAIVIVITRFIWMGIGIYGVYYVHKLAARPSFSSLHKNFRALSNIAFPVVLTNIATPFANFYITYAISSHGDDAVTAWAIINRLVPVAFGATFALSGAVGPILSQNLGARLFDRLRLVMQQSIILVSIYVLAVWLILFLGQDRLIALFAGQGETAELIRFYCTYVAASFIFMGALFTANASFNNLGFPLMSTFFNWARATLGTAPFILIFENYYGAKGVILGQGLGAMVFGIGAVVASFYVIGRLEKRVKKVRE